MEQYLSTIDLVDFVGKGEDFGFLYLAFSFWPLALSWDFILYRF